jgi:hypothetical protein
MSTAYQTAVDQIVDNNLEDYDGLFKILQGFYRQRSAEILCEHDEHGIMVDQDIKIGGTD